MTWKYRVIKTKISWKGEEFEDWYQIHEVFYNEDGSIFGYANTGVGGESIEDIRETLEWMLECLDKPILIEEEIKCVDTGDW